MLVAHVARTLLKGSESKLDDGTSGAQHNTKKLKVPAVGLLIHAGATGDIKIGHPDGSTTTIADGEVAKGVVIPVCISQVFDTGTTLADSDFRLATARY